MFAIPAPPQAQVPIAGDSQTFPVHRIYCVGRNYAEHAREMGAEVNCEQPTFFMKPADAVWTGATPLPYPSATSNLHHEVELVVALKSGGRDIVVADAWRHVFGYAVGLDLTRRDLQAAMKAKGLPWDIAKGFDRSAPISAIVPVAKLGEVTRGELALEINGTQRQRTDVSDMIFNIPEIIAELSKLYELTAGDLIFTGTPSGVGALVKGDKFRASFAGVPDLVGEIV